MADNGNHQKLLRRSEAAEYITTTYGIPCSPKTLAKLAVIGGGPAYRKAGPFPLYSPDDLNQWANNKLGPRVHSTSETKEAA